MRWEIVVDVEQSRLIKLGKRFSWGVVGVPQVLFRIWCAGRRLGELHRTGPLEARGEKKKC